MVATEDIRKKTFPSHREWARERERESEEKNIILFNCYGDYR